MENVKLTLELHPDLYAKFAAAAGQAHLSPQELLELLALKAAARNLEGKPFGSSPEDTEHLTTPSGDRAYFMEIAKEINSEYQRIRGQK